MRLYAALGDSISIDDYAGGVGRGGASLLVRNHAADFPDWHGRDLTAMVDGVRWLQLASDGATTATVVDYQLSRLRGLEVAPLIVTLTVGGNDLLSSYGDTSRALQTVDVVRHRVEHVLQELRGLTASDAQVVVGTVYDPSDGTGEAWRVGLPDWPDVVPVLTALNQALTDAAAGHGAAIADIHGRFLGHGLRAGNPAQREARPAYRDLWYCNLIEPNAWGASGVRAAFWDALDLAVWDRQPQSPV